MAAPRKSAKRSTAKKRPAAKRQTPATKKKKSKKKPASRTKALQRKAHKGLKAARSGLNSALQAGGKTWRTLKTTTTQVVEGVKETLASEPRTGAKRQAR